MNKLYLGSVGELKGFLVDLVCQFPSRGKDESERVGFAALMSRDLSRIVEDIGQHWHEECRSFTGTSLGAGHDVSPSMDNRDSVLDFSERAVSSIASYLLNRGRDSVVSKLNVFSNDRTKLSRDEIVNTSGDIFTRGFN